MIERVYGKLDGVDIILRQENGKWVVPVPAAVDGKYIFEIVAEDTAGNITFLTRMLFAVNKAEVNAYLMPLEYWGIVLPTYRADLVSNSFAAKLKGAFNVEYLKNPYSAEVLP